MQRLVWLASYPKSGNTWVRLFLTAYCHPEVVSWLDQPELPVLLVRYEDLHAAPEVHFTRTVQAAGLPVDAKRLALALARTRFERLQAQEERVRFNERRLRSSRFFRRGQADSWREELTPTQIERIIADHGSIMVRLGYLDTI